MQLPLIKVEFRLQPWSAVPSTGALQQAAATAFHQDTTADLEGVAIRVVDGGHAGAS